MERTYLVSGLALALYLSGCAVAVGPPRAVVAPPPMVWRAGPRAVLIPGTEIYYAPAVRASVYRVNGAWYYHRNDYWYWGRSYRGPRVLTKNRQVPSGVRRLPSNLYR